MATYILFVMVYNTHQLNAQVDTLYLKTSELLVGELKEMNRNVAVFETDYSDSDFKITWNKIKQISTTTQFLVTLNRGDRYSGRLKSSDDKVYIILDQDTLAKTTIPEIVYLKKIESKFLSNLKASLSLGYNFTKANQLSQFSIRSNFTYTSRRWLASSNYDQIFSSQDEVNTTRRLDANALYNYFFQKKWYITSEINWLSNTAQNINLRTVSKLGVGRYIVNSNRLYWGFKTGLSFNNESFDFENTITTNNSWEAFFGTEANLYDIGDFNLLTRWVVYPSLSESKRIRTDLNIDVKYDLPLDFFIKFGLSLNYDNQPIQSGSQTDYVFQTTLGWSL
jgi:hypothetical protein